MKQVIYPAVIHKDPDSDYSVSFPDFDGCVGAGHTPEGAIIDGREALQFHIEGMIEHNEDIPAATAIEDIERDRAFAFAMIPAKLPGKAKRVQVTLDENLIEEIDAVADNRSGFLAAAARDKLSRELADA